MSEIWKDITGYEGLYQVSNYGNVRALDRYVKNKLEDRCRLLKGKPMALNDNGKGYKFVGLSKNNKRKNYYVHKLVANAFIDNPNNYTEINHKDYNKSNNNSSNLEWCSRSFNVKDTYTKGVRIAPKSMLGRRGKEHPLSKKAKQYDLNGNFIKEYESAKLGSEATNICYMSIKKCRAGKQKTAGGYIWTY